MPDPTLITTEIAVLGAGMTGLSAAVFAQQRGLRTLVVGGPSEIAYASGPWDLLGVHPMETRHLVDDPWAGIDALTRDLPRHPYARVERDALRDAFDTVMREFREAGYPYARNHDANCDVITSVGTVKRTYCVPHTMWNGVAAWRDRVPCLVVGFEGMKDFCGRQVALTLRESWPALSAASVVFPGTETMTEVPPEYLARCLDLPATRARLADSLRDHMEGRAAVGFPAVIGLHRTVEAVADLEARLGVPVFEIPSPPVSVPGLRIRHAFGSILERLRIPCLREGRVVHASARAAKGCCLRVSGRDRDYEIRARTVLLATGRFVGGGLQAGRSKVREPLFDLPVTQPKDREDWHRATLLDPRGHPINQAGVEVDDRFRPLDREGHAAVPGLFAAGSVLAHQDWMRMKCGTGLAFGTAYAAVRAAAGSTPSTYQRDELEHVPQASG